MIECVLPLRASFFRAIRLLAKEMRDQESREAMAVLNRVMGKIKYPGMKTVHFRALVEKKRAGVATDP